MAVSKGMEMEEMKGIDDDGSEIIFGLISRETGENAAILWRFIVRCWRRESERRLWVNIYILLYC